MRLDAYLKEQGITQARFGQMLVPTVSQGLVSQWINGDTQITLSYAIQINKISDSNISVQDCADMYKIKKKAA